MDEWENEEINEEEAREAARRARLRKEKMKRRRRKARRRRAFFGLVLLLAVTAVGIGLNRFLPSGLLRGVWSFTGRLVTVAEPEIDVQLLTVNEYSRPGEATDTITGIVVHYTGNPGTTAQQNHDYFESLKDTHLTNASSNFIVGLEGEIIQCIPTSEVAYASNSRNYDTVSIECCHPDETGQFTDATYQSLVQLTAWLCSKFGLSEDSVIRHYDVTGKICPKYFVEHEDAWEAFKADVGAVLRGG